MIDMINKIAEYVVGFAIVFTVILFAYALVKEFASELKYYKAKYFKK